MCVRYKQVIGRMMILIGPFILAGFSGSVFADGAARELPSHYDPGVLFAVSIAIETPAGTSMMTLEDAPPADWAVSNISNGGFWDEVHGKVKWPLFYEPFPTEVSYDTTPSVNAMGEACFMGTVLFDTDDEPILGDECLYPPPWALRNLPEEWDPGVPFAVSITINPPAGTVAAAVEDTPPVGWTVSNISDDGVWDPVNEKVKWGLFYDPDIPAEMYYDVTSPDDVPEQCCFVGIVSCDGVNQMVEGDECVPDCGCDPCMSVDDCRAPDLCTCPMDCTDECCVYEPITNRPYADVFPVPCGDGAVEIMDTLCILDGANGIGDCTRLIGPPDSKWMIGDIFPCPPPEGTGPDGAIEIMDTLSVLDAAAANPGCSPWCP